MDGFVKETSGVWSLGGSVIVTPWNGSGREVVRWPNVDTVTVIFFDGSTKALQIA